MTLPAEQFDDMALGGAFAHARAYTAAKRLERERIERARLETSAQGTQHLATVVAIDSASLVKVDLEGTILPALVAPDQDQVIMGDTVQVSHDAGMWSITSIITKHDPPPEPSTEMSAPSRPSVSPAPVAPTPTPAGAVTAVALPVTYNYPTGSTNAQLLEQLQIIYGILSANRAAWEALNNGWLPVINTAASQAASALSYARSNAQSYNTGMGASLDYTEATSNAAAGAIAEGSAGGIKVQPFSLTAMPENIDRDGYEAWSEATRFQVTRILSWRTRSIHDLRAGVNRALAHLGLAQVAAFPATPDTVVDDDTSFSTAASKITAVDDWASSRMYTLVSAIDQIRAKQHLGKGTYSTGRTFAWSGSTYPTARLTLIVSMRNYRVWLSEAGTSLKEPVQAINTEATPAPVTPSTPTTPQKKIVGISVSAMPDNIDKATYDTWSQATRFQITSILSSAVRTILDLHAAVNRARAYYSLAAMPARPAAPDTVVDDDTSFSTAASKITAVDDWASNALNAIVTGINQVRAQAGKGNGTWSGGVLAWSGPTYPTARASLIVSMRNFRVRCSESGTALMEIVNAINA